MNCEHHEYSVITPFGWSDESQTYSLNTLYTAITIIVLTLLITYTNDYINKKSSYENCLEKLNNQTNILERIEIIIKDINVKTPTEALAEAPTEVPTEAPTEARTEAPTEAHTEEEIDFSFEEIEKLNIFVNLRDCYVPWRTKDTDTRFKNAFTNLCQANTLAMLSWYNNDKPSELLLRNEEYLPIEIIEYHLRQYDDDIFTSVTKKNTEQGLYYICDTCFKHNNIKAEIEGVRYTTGALVMPELKHARLVRTMTPHLFIVKQMMKVFDSSSEIRCFKKYKRTQEDIQYQCESCNRFVKKTMESDELIKQHQIARRPGDRLN